MIAINYEIDFPNFIKVLRELAWDNELTLQIDWPNVEHQLGPYLANLEIASTWLEENNQLDTFVCGDITELNLSGITPTLGFSLGLLNRVLSSAFQGELFPIFFKRIGGV